jgi:hypothetical protein
MKTEQGRSKGARPPKRQRVTSSPAHRVEPAVPPAPEAAEASGGRTHGDSYSDAVAREDDLVGMPSSHHPRADRRLEEPSEPVSGAPERLEGNL